MAPPKSPAAGRTQERFDEFARRACAVSAEVHRFAASAPAQAFLEAFLADSANAGAPIVWARRPDVGGIDAAGLGLPALRFDVTPEIAATAAIGISSFEIGIANTGTLVQIATSPAQRLASTLPRTHVALLGTENIVPDLAAAFRAIDPAQHPYVALITGPSRTADIERVLTIGAHGPSRLVILCIDGMRIVG